MYRSLFLFIFCIFSLTGCALSHSGGDQGLSTPSSGEKYQASLTDEERIALIRDRRTELDSLKKGDYFALRNNPDEALAYYLKVADRLPDDVVIQKKIGHAYYLKKDWVNAYKSYVRTPITELSSSEKGELLDALFFDESQLDRIGELNRMNISEQDEHYYKILDICYTGIHNCIVSIQGYTGSEKNITSIQSLIVDTAKVSPDYQYRNFAVATRLYEYGAYRASAILAREILENRPDYGGVEKLLGFSLSEIGNTLDAKKYLLAYLEKYPNDHEVMVKLGDIAFSENDPRTAIIYYNNAIIAGHMPKTDIERKLAYNYSLLADIPGMMRVLAYLIQEQDSTEDDAAVAISLALENGENLKAYIWASNAIKKYEKSPIIVALYITSMRYIGKTQDATMYITTLSESIQDAPIILLERAILMLESGDTIAARALFEKAREKDPEADFAIEAEGYIQALTQWEVASGSLEEKESYWWR